MLRANGHQCAGLLREVRVRGEEGFDLPGAGRAQAGNGRPPAPAPRNSHRQLGQGPEAMGFHGAGGTRRKPALDVVRHHRRGHRQMPQRLDRIHDRAGVLRSLGRRVFNEAGQIFPVPRARTWPVGAEYRPASRGRTGRSPCHARDIAQSPLARSGLRTRRAAPPGRCCLESPAVHLLAWRPEYFSRLPV
jgi:hypothetical protein